MDEIDTFEPGELVKATDECDDNVCFANQGQIMMNTRDLYVVVATKQQLRNLDRHDGIGNRYVAVLFNGSVQYTSHVFLQRIK